MPLVGIYDLFELIDRNIVDINSCIFKLRYFNSSNSLLSSSFIELNP